MASPQTAASVSQAPAPPLGSVVGVGLSASPHPRTGHPATNGPACASLHDHSHSRSGVIEEMRGTKRRVSDDRDLLHDRRQYPSPPHSVPRSDGRPPPANASSRNGAGLSYVSPRTQLPPFNSLSVRPPPRESGRDDAGARKRANALPNGYPDVREMPCSASGHSLYSRDAFLDDERYARPPPSGGSPSRPRSGPPLPHQVSMNCHSPPSYEERGGYQKAPHAGAVLRSPLGPAPHLGREDDCRGSIGDDSYDANVSLARRRGNAAQAKANKLHIDVESAASDRTDLEARPSDRKCGRAHGSGGGGSGPSETAAPHAIRRLDPADAGLVAHSAPPTRLSFSERDGAMDPRLVHLRHGGYPPAVPAGSHMYGSSSACVGLPPPPPHHHSAYRDAPLSGPNQGPSSICSPSNGGGRCLESASSSANMPGGGAPPSYVPGQSQHGIGTGPTPITARFAPQTASLPSPAYHSTRLLQTSGPDNGVSGSAIAALATNAPRPSIIPAAPPTARLPDHLRSPPSSKTQFLSLFSNFYDSLSDSRTLKATLEDQVRRSNTLLQTLQKSSKVLEATVDRKIREERSFWERRVKHLEAKVRRLEGGVGGESMCLDEDSHVEKMFGGQDARDVAAEREASKVINVESESVPKGDRCAERRKSAEGLEGGGKSTGHASGDGSGERGEATAASSSQSVNVSRHSAEAAAENDEAEKLKDGPELRTSWCASASSSSHETQSGKKM